MACVDQLKVHVDHMNNKQPGKIQVIRFVLVTNWAVATANSYEGQLDAWNTPIASGSGFRYSSYERWNFPGTFQNPQFDPQAYPFDPNRRNAITLSVNLTTGQVAGAIVFQAQCENGVLYGFGEPAKIVGFPTMHVLALLDLTQAETPVPK